MKVLLTLPLKEDQLQALRDLSYEVVHELEKDSQYLEAQPGVEVLVCFNPFQKLTLDKLPDLKLIQLASIGFDQLPAYDYENIEVCNNHGAYSPQIGEWVVAMMLMIFKELRLIDKQQRERLYKPVYSVQELTGKKVLFLGTGTLAVESAMRLMAFDMQLDGMNTTGREVLPFEHVYALSELSERVSDYEIIVCTLPATRQTTGLLDEAFFSRMADGSVFINVSRGKVVKEQALIAQAHRLKAIALDVFEQEPLSPESALWELPNVYLSAHNSWVSQWNGERRFHIFHENLRRYRDGEELLNRIDIERGY